MTNRVVCGMCRAMEFVVALLLRLHDDPAVTLPTAASDSYTATLYRYHGWVTSAAFTLALKVHTLCGCAVSGADCTFRCCAPHSKRMQQSTR